MTTLGVLLGMLASLPAAGGEGEQPIQELFRTEVVYPQQKREVQLTATLVFARGRQVGIFRTALGFEYGITDRWQIGSVMENVSGAGEIELSVKRSFMHLRGPVSHLALGFEASLPKGQIAEGEGAVAYSPFAVWARDVGGDRAQLFGTARVNLAQAGNDVDVGGEFYRVALGGGGFIRLGPAVVTSEFNWITPGWKQFSSGGQGYWTPGVVLRLDREHDWELGAGMSIGLTRHSDPACLMVRFTHEFTGLRLFN